MNLKKMTSPSRRKNLKEVVLISEELERVLLNGEIILRKERIKPLNSKDHFEVCPGIGSSGFFALCVFKPKRGQGEKIFSHQIVQIKALTQETIPLVKSVAGGFEVGIDEGDLWKEAEKIKNGCPSEVLLTTGEFLEFARKKYLNIPSFRIKREIPNEKEALISHLELAPDIGKPEESFILCKFKLFDEGQKIFFLDQVKLFSAMSEDAMKILQILNIPEEAKNLLTYVKQCDWEEAQKKMVSKKRNENGYRFLSLISSLKSNGSRISYLYDRRKSLTSKLLDMEELDAETIEKNETFIGTSAGGYKIALSYLALEFKSLSSAESQKNEKNEDPILNTWKELHIGEKLKELYKNNKSGPVLDEDFNKFLEALFSTIKKQPLSSSIDIEKLKKDFIWRTFFYHYNGLLGEEDCRVNVIDLAQDVKRLIDRFSKSDNELPDDVLDMLYLLGGELPDDTLFQFENNWERPKVRRRSKKAEKSPKIQNTTDVQQSLFNDANENT